MEQLTDTQILTLLVRVVNCTIQDFYFFPDVIKAGRQRIEKEEFHFLLSEGYIFRYKADSFGCFYKHTPKAEKYICHFIHSKHYYYKKKRKTPNRQGLLNFDLCA